MEQFGIKHYRAISIWLESTALQTTQGIVLVQAAVDELRRQPKAPTSAGISPGVLSPSESVFPLVAFGFF
jgi:hypothetical protein